MLKYKKFLENNLKQVEINGKNYSPCYLPKKKIVIIGNGFDLRAGIPSSFADFIRFIVYFCGLYNYQYSNYLQHYQIFSGINDFISKELGDKTDYESIKKFFLLNFALKNLNNNEIKTKIFSFIDNKLGKLIIKNVFPHCYSVIPPNSLNKIHTSPASTNDEEFHRYFFKSIYGLEIISDNLYGYYNTFDKMQMKKGIETFIYTIDRELSDSRVKLWLDIESVIEMIVTSSDELKDKYGFRENISLDKTSIDAFLNGVNLFEQLFADYLVVSEEHFSCKNRYVHFFNHISADFRESLAKRSNFLIEDLDIRYATTVINYNYTNIAEKIYKKHNPNIDIRYINGTLHVNEDVKLNEIDTNIVIGYSNLEGTKVRKDQFPFEKKSRRILKNTEYIDIESIINNEPFELIIIGHSCGIADSDIIKPLLENEYLKTAVILCHTIDDLFSIFNNIKEMLDKKVFDLLFSHNANKTFRNLFFSVENTMD